MKVAITGATGYLGQFITAQLLQKGFQIKAITRNKKKAEALFPKVEWISAKLSPHDDYTNFLKGCNGLIHAAFDHVKGRYRGGEGDDVEAFLNTNIQGSLNLLHQAKNLSFGVFISSRAVYGTSPYASEKDTVAPDSHYGDYKAQVEEYILSQRLPLAILRPTGVYGIISPFHHSKWHGLIQDIKQGKTPKSNHRGTEVHGDDVAQAVFLLLNPLYRGEIFNCSDFLISHRQIAEKIQKLYGLKGALPPLPTREVMPMPTDKLRNIGWQPSGEKKLIETLQRIYNKL